MTSNYLLIFVCINYFTFLEQNLLAERKWLEVNQRVVYPIKEILYECSRGWTGECLRVVVFTFYPRCVSRNYITGLADWFCGCKERSCMD